MRKLQARVLAIPFALLAITATFQNCSAGFTYDAGTGALSASSTNDLTGVFGLKVYSAGGFAVAPSLPLDPGVAYELRATGSNTGAALLLWSLDPSSTASCLISSVGNVVKRELKCSTAGSVTVNLQAIWETEEVSYASHTHTVGASSATPTPVQVDENTVLFTIANGVAGGAWNTQASQILVFVGQNLRVVNNDSVDHRIQTNGQPFVAQTDQILKNGGSKDFPVTGVIASGNTTTFDANFGANARIFIESIDGDAKYAANGGANIGSCASCHGNINSSNKRGTSLGSLKSAIAANRGNMGNITLPEKDLMAIAYALNH